MSSILILPEEMILLLQYFHSGKSSTVGVGIVAVCVVAVHAEPRRNAGREYDGKIRRREDRTDYKVFLMIL
jgi:hypothetical protein